jgi:hypothetical protein
MALAGYGAIGICKRLNASGVKPIGKTPQWNYPYINRILTNRSVLGEYQAHCYVDGRERRTGEPVKNYFPRVISDRLFNQVQATMRGRAPQFGRVGKDVSNLFTGLLFDARDGRQFSFRGKNIIDHKGTPKEKRRRYRYLINSGAVHGEVAGNGTPAPYKIGFPYAVFEAMFLLAVKELKVDDFSPDHGNGVAKLAALLDRQTEIAANIAATKRRVTNPEKGIKVDTLLDLLVDLEQERSTLQVKIDEQKLKATGHSTHIIKETQGLVERLEAAKGDARTDLRERIRGRIKALVDRIYLLIWRGKNVKHVLAQIHFFNGSVRLLYLSDQWDGRTLLNPAMVPERDLRNYREHPWELDEVTLEKVTV